MSDADNYVRAYVLDKLTKQHGGSKAALVKSLKRYVGARNARTITICEEGVDQVLSELRAANKISLAPMGDDFVIALEKGFGSK